MSRGVKPVPNPTLVCEWCGAEIEDVDQDCPARDDGRCSA